MPRKIFDYLILCSKNQCTKQVTYFVCNRCTQCNIKVPGCLFTAYGQYLRLGKGASPLTERPNSLVRHKRGSNQQAHKLINK